MVRGGEDIKAYGKVIAIRLPENHPIFQIDTGKRSEIARSLLDAGSRLERLEEKVERILKILETNPHAHSPKSKQEDNNNFNKDSFLSYFE